MDTRAFTAALVALALMTGCTPNANTPSTPTTQGAPGTPGAGATGTQGPQGAAPQGAPGGRGGGGFPGGGGNGRQAVVTVQTETVKSGVLWVDNTTAGAVVPETQSTVAAGASGTVRQILRQVGDWVEEGTPVVQLDDTQLKLSLRLAQASLEDAKMSAGITDTGTGFGTLANLKLQPTQSALATAQRNYASAQTLAKAGGITNLELENSLTLLQNAQANYESAKLALQQSGLKVETTSIQLQQAELNLANATIKAPYAGQISAINLHPGEFVGTSTASFSLVSRTKVISFGVSPSEAPGLTLGSPVKFTYGGKSATSQVSQAPSAPVNGLVPLTAWLPTSITAPLGTVGTLSYRLPVAEGVLVPLPALQSAENKTFVFTADQGKARRHEVTVLGDSGTYTAVSGLASGASVIVNPPPGLLVGATVQAVAQEGAVPQAGTGVAAPTGGQKQRPAGVTGAGGVGGATGAEGTATGGVPPAPAEAQGAPGTGQRRRPAGDAGGLPGGGTQPGATAEGQPPAGGQGQGQWTGQRRRPSGEAGAPAAGPAAPAPTTGGQ